MAAFFFFVCLCACACECVWVCMDCICAWRLAGFLWFEVSGVCFGVIHRTWPPVAVVACMCGGASLPPSNPCLCWLYASYTLASVLQLVLLRTVPGSVSLFHYTPHITDQHGSSQMKSSRLNTQYNPTFINSRGYREPSHTAIKVNVINRSPYPFIRRKIRPLIGSPHKTYEKKVSRKVSVSRAEM